jgi:hypothetical protein
MLLSTCTCQLPWFLVANKIFKLNLLFSTRSYSWNVVGNVVGKRVFFTNDTIRACWHGDMDLETIPSWHAST